MADTILQTVNEETSAYLTVEFYDKTGTLALPASVEYRVDCVTTGTAIRAATAIVPATSVEVALDTDDTRIVTQTNPFEERCVTVVATYGPKDAISTEYRFRVKNLNYVT